MESKYIVLLVVVLSIGIIGYSIVNNTDNQDTIKIGVFTVLSGDAASYGEDFEQGMNLALEEINENNYLDKKIEIIYEDSHLDADAAIQAINKLIYMDKVDFIVSGEGSSATLATVDIADKTNTPYIISIASAPELKNSGNYVFRIVLSDDYQGKAIAEFANNYEKTAILYVNDTYGQGIKDVFKANYKKTLTNTESFTPNSMDFTTQLTKIKSNNPDLILIVARIEFPEILKQINKLEINAQIFGSEMFANNEIIAECNGLAEGAYSIYYQQEDLVGYTEKYKEKYKAEPLFFGKYGYDSLKIIAQTIKNTNSLTPEEIRNNLYKTNYIGATGQIVFDNQGEVINKEMTICQIENNEIVDI